MVKSGLEPKQIFDFIGYQYHLREGKVRPTLERLQTLNLKIQELLTVPYYWIRQLMSLIGLLTATGKQVYQGQFQMRPIQWHLKKSHLKMVAPRCKCPSRSATTPIQPCLLDLYRCVKGRQGSSLRRSHSKRDLVLTRKQVVYKPPGIKSGLSARTSVKTFVLLATDNTIVDTNINKEGCMMLGPLCALLWQIL